MMRPVKQLCLLLSLLVLLSGCSSTVLQSMATSTPLVVAQPASTPRVFAEDLSMGIVLSENTDRHPARTRSRDLLSLYGLVYEGLLYFGEEQRPTNELAERWTTTDYKSWQITLRSDISFHDGSPLTAQDVKASIEYLQGLEGSTVYSDTIRHIESAEVLSDSELTLRSVTPGYAFLWALCFPVFPASSLNADSDIPPGTGPYRVESYPVGGELRLVRNEGWWKRAAGIASLTAIPFADIADALTALKQGDINMLASNQTAITQFRNNAHVETLDYQSNQLEYLLPNMNNALLRDVRMRKAIISAIDRRKLIESAYMGLALSTDVPFVPGTCLYNAKSAVYDYDPDLARGLLEELGFRDFDDDGILQSSTGNLQFSLIVCSNGEDSRRIDAARRIVDDLGDIGIEIKLEKLSQEDMTARLGSGDFDLAIAGLMLSDLPDISSFIATEGALNYGGYSNASLDDQLQTVKNAADENSFYGALNLLQNYFVQELPVICLYFRAGMLVTNQTLGDMRDIREMDVLRDFETILRNTDSYSQSDVQEIPSEIPTFTPKPSEAPQIQFSGESEGDGADE